MTSEASLVQCSVCGHSNVADATFCSSCGNRVSLRCPACSTPYQPGDNFCSTCGTDLRSASAAASSSDFERYVPAEMFAKLDAARRGRAMAGERRTVTMLFADIEGSTAAAEQLDPEEWAEIVNGAFERLIEPVYRYEGTLANLMGDAILAFFGAPIAHEDDPERAVNAGLEMLSEGRAYARRMEDEWGVRFDLRVGINTGLVVVGEIGSDLRVDYTAIGDAVNVAARMEQTARAGTLQISASTQSLVEGLYEFERLAPVAAKGKTEPVEAFLVTGKLVRPASTRRFLGRDAALVGREAELDALRGVVDGVRRGQGQICTIVGEAGVGKSRLIEALQADLDAHNARTEWQSGKSDPEAVQWAEARCLSYNTGLAYGTFVDLLSRAWGLGTRVENGGARERIETAVETAAPPNPDVVIADLCTLLDVELTEHEAAVIADLSAPALQQRVFSSIVAYIEACSSAAPCLLLIEDLHWADPVSLALLDELMAVTTRSRLAIVGVSRPYRDHASWGFHETAVEDHPERYTSVTLNPLDDASAGILVERLLGSHQLPEDLQSMILERSDGNPLYVEEILHELMESGMLEQEHDVWVLVGDMEDITIPPGLTALLTARLDRLDEAPRLVAQLASVIGRQFDSDELAEIAEGVGETETALDDLVARELLIEHDTGLARSFVFRHVLIQEAAYSTILLKSRRHLHSRVAEHLIARESEPQEIARHLLESKQEGRAVPFLVNAADRAARSMSLADAIRLYDEAAKWVDDGADIDVMRRIHEGLGAAYTLIPDLTQAAASYQQMLELGKARGAAAVQISALNRLGFTAAFLGGDMEAATGHLEEARRLAEEAGDDIGLAEYHMNSCLISTVRGDVEQAAAHDAETARLGSETGSNQVALSGMLRRVLSLALATRHEEGRRSLERAREATAGITDPVVRGTLAEAEVFFLVPEGRIGDAWAVAREAAEEAVRIRSSVAAVLAYQAGSAAAMLGDPENALAMHAEAMRLGGEAGQVYYSAGAAAAMIRLYEELGMGGNEQVPALRDAVEQYQSGPVGRALDSSILSDLGWAAIESGDMPQAEALFREGVTGSSSTRLIETPPLLFGLAIAEANRGDSTAAREHITEASEFMADRGMRQFGPIESLAIGRLHQAEGRFEEAADAFVAGAERADALGASDQAWRLRAAAARVLRRAGSDERAARLAQEANRIVARIADRIADPSIRDAFVAHAATSLAAGAETTP